MSTLRQSVRQLSRRRAATALSVGLLTLGVGFSAAFWSVLDSALLSGLPFPGGDRLLAFSTREAPGWPMPLEDYRDIESATLTFEWTRPLRTFNTMVTRGEQTRGLIGSYVPVDLFGQLDVEPLLGRGFTVEDEDPANPPVALISHRLWQSSYGADPEILGQEITINRERSVVVGVMPPGFRFPLRHDLWGVFGRKGRQWEDGFVFAIGMLSRGSSIDSARQDLGRIVSLMDEARPESEPRNTAIETYVRANIGDRAQGGLRAMVFASFGLLALTCANLANLRLSESLRRSTEIDTRIALGSGPAGIARLLLIENLILGVLSVALGLVLAGVLIETLSRTLLDGGGLERIFWIRPALDARSATLAAGCALAASLLGALAPIVSATLRTRAGRIGAASESRTHTASWSRGLVSLQVGLCFALLVAAGLWGLRARALLDAEPGFRTARLSSTQLSVYQANLDDPAARRDVFDRLLNDLGERPGVASAAYASRSPWGYVPRSPVAASTLEPDRKTAPRAAVLEVSPGFFETLELALEQGRGFVESDLVAPATAPDDVAREGAAREAVADAGDAGPADEAARASVAIVSRGLAQRLFDDHALDRVLTLAGRRSDEPSRQVRIIGIAADLRLDRTDNPNRNLMVYLPSSVPEYGVHALIRRQPGLGSAESILEGSLARVAPLVGTVGELSVDQALDASVWVERRLGQIFSLFAFAALLLTAGGIYAVIAVMVRSRARELGIRAAIGARPADLRRLVLGESVRQLAIGLAAGGLALWAGSRLLDESLVEGLRVQPAVVAIALLVVTLGSIVGSWAPTRQAAKTDPARCLTSE